MATVQTPKDAKVATKSTEMTLDEKREQLRQLQAEIEQETIKEFEKDINYIVARAKNQGRKLFDYMEGLYKVMPFDERSAFADNFRKIVGIAAAAPTAPATRKPRSPNGTVKPGAEKPYIKGVTYKYQNDTWVGGTKGRQPPFLRDLIPDTMTFEEKKAKFAELAVK